MTLGLAVVLSTFDILSTGMPATLPHQNPTHTTKQPDAKKTQCLVDPTRFKFKNSEFEYSVYSPSHRILREITSVFPDLSIRQRKNLLIVPVIQRCEHDMVGATPEVNKERDDKLELV